VTLKSFISQYRDLSQVGGFTPTLAHTQTMQDFVANNAAKLDFLFEEPQDIFRLIGIMISRKDSISFRNLLDAGLDINLLSASFETVFTTSATSYLSDLDFVKIAVEVGANFSLKTRDNKGFFELVFNNWPWHKLTPDVLDYIFALPQFNQELNQPQSDGRHLFHIAVAKGYMGIVVRILNLGYDVNTLYTYETLTKENITQSALHLACEKLELNMFNLLLERGADINAINSKGSSVLNFILQDTHYIKHTRSASQDIRIGMTDMAVLAGLDKTHITKAFYLMLGEEAYNLNGCRFCRDMALRLLNHGADVMYATDNGNSAIHLSAKSGNIEVFKIALKSGADINAKNNNGDSPLMLAARECRDQIVMTLIRLGADTEATNLQGVALLDILTKSGNAPMIEFMLTSQANLK